MKQRKTLGLIAYEADAKARKVTYAAWDAIDHNTRTYYERMAQAVAKAVKRRGEEQGVKQ